MKWSYYNSFTYQEHIQLTITFLIILIITTKEIVGNFTEKYPKPKTVTLEKPQLQACQKKKCNQSGAQHQYFLIFFQPGHKIYHVENFEPLWACIVQDRANKELGVEPLAYLEEASPKNEDVNGGLSPLIKPRLARCGGHRITHLPTHVQIVLAT